MTETTVRKTVKTKRFGNTDVIEEKVNATEEEDPGEFALAKFSQFFWFIGHVIAVLLALRFIFLLLGANLTGIVLFIYNITNVLVAPFRGIFPNVRTGESFFDTAALLAIIMYYLAILLIDRVILLFSKSTEV